MNKALSFFRVVNNSEEIFLERGEEKKNIPFNNQMNSVKLFDNINL